VLLKNSSKTLPLRKDLQTIAVIGPLADDAHSSLGGWAADGRDGEALSVLAGVRAAVGPAVKVIYARGSPVDTADTTGFAAARAAVAQADAIVLVLGETENMSGEASNRASIALPGLQLELARAVLAAARRSTAFVQTDTTPRPVAVVLMNGRALAIPELAREAPAILETWFLGNQHGAAVADVLFGDYNPGGKLPVTFPRATGQIPIYYNHRNTGRPSDTTNHYTSRYLDLPSSPLFPFGYGLSYTTFAYSNLRLSAATIAAGDSLEVSVDVRNSGDRGGEEVVQLYVRDDVASVEEPVKRLVGFQRIISRSGDTRTVTFRIRPESLALYDRQMRHVVEPGTFTVYVGTSSDDVLTAHFAVTGDVLVLAPAPTRFR
jgi:beta-glucosidase